MIRSWQEVPQIQGRGRQWRREEEEEERHHCSRDWMYQLIDSQEGRLETMAGFIFHFKYISYLSVENRRQSGSDVGLTSEVMNQCFSFT